MQLRSRLKERRRIVVALFAELDVLVESMMLVGKFMLVDWEG